MRRVTYWVDMDGVLAKWDTTATVADTHKRGYFSSRIADETAVAVVQRLCVLRQDVRILSAAYPNGYAEAEKREWLEKNGLGHVPAVFVPYGEDKAAYVSSGGINILLDDHTPNLLKWTFPDAIGVKYLNGINRKNYRWKGHCASHEWTAYHMCEFLLSLTR